MNKYQALQVIRSNYPTGRNQLCEALETFIPELKESEDDKMRAMAIKAVHAPEAQSCIKSWGINPEDVIAWLEKQNKQNPTDNAEPKFKVGDWIVYCDEDVDLVTGIEEKGYCINKSGYIPFISQENIRLWTIQDAKDGDILASVNGCPFIYKNTDGIEARFYCCVSITNNFCTADDAIHCGCKESSKPATKEQRCLLFSKMKEAGYEWDAEKKELKKIELIENKDVELTDFESALFTSFSDAWQQYLHGEEVDVEQWAKEHSSDLLEVARQGLDGWSEEDERMLNLIIQDYEAASKSFCGHQGKLNWLKSLRPQHHWKPSEEEDAVGMLVNLGYPISTNGEIPTYEETFDDCKQALLHCLQKKVHRVLLNKSISLSSGGINTETLLKENYMQAYKEGVDDIIKLLKEICS